MLSRVLAALLWIALGASKALSPAVFASYLASRLALESSGLPRLLAWTLIGTELSLGVALLVLSRARPAKILCLASTALAAGFILLAYSDSPSQECGCFGAVARATRSSRILVASTLAFLSLTSVLHENRKRAEAVP